MKVVSRHLTKGAAHEAASTRAIQAGRMGGVSTRHSSGHARLHYDVKPWLRFFYKVVER